MRWLNRRAADRPTRPTRPPLGVVPLEDRLAPAALDLTARGTSGQINGAYFRQYDARPTGTGLIDSFLRVQGAAARGVVQQGFNTDARPVQFDENKSPQFTRSLRAADLPEVNVGGVTCKEFLLDVNQKSAQPYLSLDRVQVFVSGDPRLGGYDPAAGTLGGRAAVYDLDAGGDNWVKLDYRLNTGSGSGDMLLYVPAGRFAGGEYVALYSRFGEHFASNAGFQEWARGKGVPVAGNTGGIAGSVFFDADRDGTRAEGEPGYGNSVVYLDANGSGRLDPDEVYTITDADGRYSFDQLATGSAVGYAVRLESQPTNQPTTPLDPPLIFLAPGEFRDKVDFGFYFAPGE